MRQVADVIPGYTYGTATVPKSPITLVELEQLKISAGFATEDERFLRLAGEVLADQTRQIVEHWRSGIIASIPHLARHSQSPDGQLLPGYLKSSNLRFQQWILDTCLRPYDQDWLNYQHEIALRHTTAKKNQVDAVSSTTYVPFHDIIAFTATMNATIKVFLAAKAHSLQEVEHMHQSWRKSIQLQLALWSKTYMDASSTEKQW